MKVLPLTIALASASAFTFLVTSSASADSTYTIKSGDTLSKIAKANDTTVDSLAQLNNISNVNLIVAGSTLQLSGQAPAVHVDVQPTQRFVAEPVQTPSAPVQESAPVAQPTVQTSDALQALINRESGGNVNATNGQYFGVGQLSPQARAMYGGNSTDLNDQVNAMKSYISARYGTPENALAHSNATGWY